jgi:hypothetical protein
MLHQPAQLVCVGVGVAPDGIDAAVAQCNICLYSTDHILNICYFIIMLLPLRCGTPSCEAVGYVKHPGMRATGAAVEMLDSVSQRLSGMLRVGWCLPLCILI